MGPTSIILALVIGSPFSGSTGLRGSEALQQLTDFQTKYVSDARAAGKRINTTEYQAAIKQKAEELLAGFDTSSVPTGEILDWAQILGSADRNQDSLIILERFIGTKPSAEDMVTAKLTEFTDYTKLKLNDKAKAILLEEKPVTDPQATQMATQDRLEATIIARSDGDEAALKFLDSVEMKLTGHANAEKILKATRSNIEMPATRNKMVGSMAPELSLLPDMYGSFTNLSSLRGKVVILDFFAHWCGPCKASFPDMRKLSDDLTDKLQVIGVTGYYGYFGAKKGVDQKEEFADMKGFMDEYKIDHPVVYIDRKDFAVYGANGIPEFVLIGKDGMVKNVQVGYSADSFAKFRKLVEAETAK